MPNQERSARVLSSPKPNLGTAQAYMTSGGDHWRPVQTCSFEDLPLERYLVVASETETGMVSKLVVSILLECFPVCFTLGPAYKEFGYNEHPDTKSK